MISAASMATPIARFFGAWNCAQSRSAMKASIALCSSARRSDIVRFSRFWAPARLRLRRAARSGGSRRRSERLVGAEVAPLSCRQLSEHDAARAHALEPGNDESDQFTHAPYLTLSAFAQREPELVLVLPGYARRLQLDAVEFESMLEQLHARRRQRSLDAYQVFLL